MATIALAIGALAAFGQFLAKPAAVDILGLGRTVQPLNNGNCQRIPGLSGCEDFWMHHESGLLYAACSDGAQRHHWLPAALKFDVEHRPKTDAVYVFDTRADGPVASRITKLRIDGFSGVHGDGTINLHGIGVHIMPSQSASTPDEAPPKPSLRLFLNNHRPTLDARGRPVDNNKTGANSTVEIFETTLGSDSMKHIKTFHDPLIRTPNRVAPAGPDSFLFTNDHFLKTGHYRDLLELIGMSDVGFCDNTGCNVVLSMMPYPNGILNLRERNKFIIPSSMRPYQWLTEFDPATKKLNILSKIPIGMPGDNDGQAANGDVYVTAFPHVHSTGEVLTNPNSPEKKTPSAVFRIPAEDIAMKGKNGWHVEKVFEDDGRAGNMQTISVADGKKLYLAGLTSETIAVCQLP